MIGPVPLRSQTSLELGAAMAQGLAPLPVARFTAHTCIAVFDRATTKLGVRDVSGLAHHPKFAEVLSDYEIALDDSANVRGPRQSCSHGKFVLGRHRE